MINFRFITNIIGKLLFVESAFLILCIIVALIYGENDLMAFIYSSIIRLGVGSLMTFTVKVKDRVLAKKRRLFYCNLHVDYLHHLRLLTLLVRRYNPIGC